MSSNKSRYTDCQLSAILSAYRTFLEASSWDGVGFSFDESVARETLVTNIRAVCPKVSPKTIVRLLHRVTSQLARTQGDGQTAEGPGAYPPPDSLAHIADLPGVRAELVSLVDQLNDSVLPLTVFAPLEGIDLQVDELELGGVRLYPITKGPILHVLEAEDDRPAQAIVREEFEGGPACYAAVEVEGEFYFALEEAEQRVQDALHVLNLYFSFSRYARGMWRRIGILGEPTRLHNRLFFAAKTEDLAQQATPRIGLNQSAPPVEGHPINAQLVESWRVGYELDEAIACFGGTQTAGDSMRLRLRRAITWYSKAINMTRADEQVVALATALESLLVGGGTGSDPRMSWGSISQRLADRVAFLLGDSLESRREYAKLTKQLYGVRSKVVHEGLSATPEEVAELELLASVVILKVLRMLKTHFGSWDSFMAWEKELKYSVPGDTP